MPQKPKYEELEKRVQELEQTAEELAQIFSMSLDMICIADINTAIFIKVNSAFTEILGHSENELLGSSFLDFAHPDDIEATRDLFEQKLRLGAKVVNFENRYRCLDGSYIWLSWVSHPNLEKGVTFSIARDITEFKQKEKELKDSKELLDATGRMARVGGWELDADTLEVTWTEETYRIHEIPLDKKPLLQNAINFFHPEDRSMLERAIQRSLNYGEPYDMEIRFITARGKHLWTRTSCEPEIIDGRTVKLKGTFQDITDRKKIEDDLRDSKTRYEEVISMISDIVWRYEIDSQGQFVNSYISPVADRLLGLASGTMGNSFEKFFSFIHPEDLPGIQEKFLSTLTSVEKDSAEYRICRPDGKVCWVRSHGSAHLNPDGHVIAIGTTTDITEQKRAEEALAKSEETLRAMFDASPIAMVLIDRNGIILDSNGEHANRLKKKREEILDQCLWKLLPKDVREHRKTQVESVFKTGIPFSGEDKRETIWNEYRIHPAIKNSKNEIEAVIVEALDITERKRAELALRHEEEKFRTLIENIVDWVWMVDTRGRYTYVSPQAKEIMGYDADEILGKTPFDFMSSDEAQRVAPIFSKAVEKCERIFALQDTLLAKDGAEVIFETNSTPLFGQQGDMIGYMGTCRDITERKKAEESLRESEERYRKLVNTAPYGIQLTDRDGKILFSNPAHHKIQGYANGELIGKYIWESMADEELIQKTRAYYEKLIQEQPEPEVYFNRDRTRDGREIDVQINWDYIYDSNDEVEGIISIISDISHQMRLEEEIRKAQRMESIGNLAGGIAHDFNNILFPIVGISEMLLEDLPAGSPERENAEEIFRAGKRGSELVKQILAFSRQSEHKMVPTRVQHILKEVLKLSRSTIPTYIDIQ